MKNCIIAMLMTYIFWNELCVDKSYPVVTVAVWLVFWLAVWAVDEWQKDFRRKHRRGSYLVNKIKKMERSW